MRAVDAWAIEEQGVPSLDLMERAGHRARAGDRRGRAAGAGPDRGRQGQQRRRRARGRRGCCARTATRSTCSPRPLDGLKATPRQPRAPARRPAAAFEPAARGLRRGGRRPARHRLRGRAARAGRGRDRRDQRPGRAGGGLRRALRRERVHRRGRGARRCAPHVTATFHGSKIGPARGAGQRHAGASRWSRSAIPRGAPGSRARPG